MASCIGSLVASNRIEAVQDSEQESDQARVIRLFRTGQYRDAASLAKSVDASLGKYSLDERWPIYAIRSELAIGQYSAALETLNEALERFPNSIRIRWIGAEVCRFNDDPKRAMELLRDIDRLVSSSSWRYRDLENQIIASRYLLYHNADAKQVMQKVLDPVRQINSRNPAIYATIGELALEKHDFALAAENFQKAIELDAEDPDLHFGLAQAFYPSDHQTTSASIQAALSINENHVPSLLMLIDQHINAEEYERAEDVIQRTLKINPHQPIAWAYRAVLAHLANNPGDEGNFRGKGLKHWPGNPEVDYTIGRKLSQKYRFKESVAYQRRSLVYQEDFLPAKMQLAHDLLRLGQELEGWKLADEVFDVDQYNVVAHNLVTLRDQLSRFRTIESDGFVVRMDREESFIYGPRVLELLQEARKQLCEKYDVELQTPVFIEIFPRQQDFAIRTFGLPGGSGFLGVCFGRLVTMNSPAAQGANLTSWESVLWHEFCHVVTLQKTNNKMPRWLSEGISVYEERLADRAWGESINPRYRTMLLGDDLTPVSQLSSAFLSPKSALHLQFAYFESSLVVEYIVDQYGIEALNRVLDDLAIGTPVNDALRRHVAPVEFLDKKFAAHARAMADDFAGGASWDKPELTAADSLEQWKAWAEQHPDNLPGQLVLAEKLFESGELEPALAVIEAILKFGDEVLPAAQLLRSRVYRSQSDSENEQRSLEAYVSLDSDTVEPLVRLLEVAVSRNDWSATKKFARRLIALNPLTPTPHRYLLMAAEKTNDDEATIQSLGVLVKMDPLDAADLHHRLASAHFRQQNWTLAKRHVLIALEEAPRYRDAHRLLLKIREQLSTTTDPDIASPEGKSDASASPASSFPAAANQKDEDSDSRKRKQQEPPRVSS